MLIVQIYSENHFAKIELIQIKKIEIIETPLEKYFGIPLSWCCRTDPIDFGNDPSKVKELILAETELSDSGVDILLKFIENNPNLEKMRFKFDSSR